MKATATNVSRVLGKKFNRSKSSASMVKGLPLRSTGFEVERKGPSSAYVRHINNGYAFSASAQGKEATKAALEKYATYLTEQGFDAQVLTSRFGYGEGVAVKTKEA